jgi:hypothetical protein
MLKALGGFAVAGGGGGVGAVTYKGTWNASTNTPTLVSSTGTQGDYYVVNVAGSTNLDGITDWQIGDWAIFNGTAWEKVDNTDSVSSVNGQVGTVVLTAANVNAAASNVYVIAGTGLGGGGNLEANVNVFIANTAVTPDSYGSANTIATFTVDQQGRLTAASNVTVSITNAEVSGLGTMSTQDASNVNISGGVIEVANLTAANVSVTANLFANLATAATATFATDELPLVPEGYVSIVVNGTTKKIPYYGV